MWKISLAELQSTVSELEARLEGQTANIESLTSTLNTKEEIINVSLLLIVWHSGLGVCTWDWLLNVSSLQELHQRLAQRGDVRLPLTLEQTSQPGVTEPSLASLPRRESTLIGGDSQREVPERITDVLLVVLFIVVLTSDPVLLMLVGSTISVRSAGWADEVKPCSESRAASLLWPHQSCQTARQVCTQHSPVTVRASKLKGLIFGDHYIFAVLRDYRRCSWSSQPCHSSDSSLKVAFRWTRSWEMSYRERSKESSRQKVEYRKRALTANQISCFKLQSMIK